MSYILDALRKSDLQRQYAKPPTLLTSHTLPATPAPRRVGLQAALAVALIGAGMLIGWLRPWQSPPPVAAPVAVITQPPRTASGGTAIPASRPALPFADVAEQLPRRDSTPVIRPLDAEPDAHGKAASRSNPPEHSVAADSPREPPANPGPQPAAPATGGKLPQLADLPADLRREIPDLLIAFHQYAEAPEQRRVMINNLLPRPGEFIAPGLKLEQITPEGVELSYQGRRFLRGVR